MQNKHRETDDRNNGICYMKDSEDRRDGLEEESVVINLARNTEEDKM